jgi:hypothetical protein
MRAHPARPLAAAAATLWLLGGLAFCTPFSSSEPDFDADGGSDANEESQADASSSLEASTTADADAAHADAADADADPPMECFYFTQDDHGFTKTGSATRETTGFVIPISNGTSSSIYRMFQHTGPITRSVVRMVAWRTILAGTWQDGAYAGFFSQYFGDAVSFRDAPATETVLASSRFEVNVWNEADEKDDTYAVSSFSFTTSPVTMTFDTTWNIGRLEVDIGTYSHVIDAKDTTTLSNELTLVIGGGISGGSLPAMNLFIQSLCIGFE